MNLLEEKKMIPNFLSDTFHSKNCNVTNPVAYLGVVKAVIGVLVERKLEASGKKNANLKRRKTVVSPQM